MRVDLHNHTILCNHAQGSVESYIQKAISLGIDVYGFTDHAPMNFDPKYRMSIDFKEFYESTILHFKNKYKNQINILLGYEVDFMQNIPMLDEILNADVDYLIGSIHFLESKKNNLDDEPWGFDNPEFIGNYKKKNIDDIWIDYFEAVRLLAKTGKFDVIGHLDLIKVFKYLPNKDIKQIAKDALKQIKKSNMVIEINSAGLRKPIEQPYPSKELLELSYELNIPITFSSDAHSLDQIGFSYDKVTTLAKQIGYKKCSYFNKRDRIEVDF
ncbi:histidinol-phosphatase [Malaciobacter sp. WC5094]